MSILTGTLSKSDNQRSILIRLWDLLTRPSDLIKEPDKRQQARFIAALLAFLFPTTTFLVLNSFISPSATSVNATSANRIIQLLIVVLLGVMYYMSRTKNAEVASIILVGTSTFLILILYLTNHANANTLLYLTLDVLFASILLTFRATVIAVIVTVAGLLLVSKLATPVPPDMSSTSNFVVLFSGLILVTMHFRNVLENTRKAAITQAMKKVEVLNQTLSLTNQDLAKANELANESIRLKSEFMANISHELRTPLNAMLGFSGILLAGIGGEMDAETNHMVDRIEQNSKRLLSLINNMLDIAKIEAGRLEIVSEPVNPRKMVEAWRSQVGVLAEQKALAFTTEIDPSIPAELYGDSERISQVVINLLSNAIKFTESGDVNLALKTKDDFWVIEVADSGIGIPPHALNYIFDEFRQIDGSSQRAYGGTGLGLAIVRNLCQMMNGTVQVTSKLGVGSTFTVTLPLKPVPTPEPIAI